MDQLGSNDDQWIRIPVTIASEVQSISKLWMALSVVVSMSKRSLGLLLGVESVAWSPAQALFPNTLVPSDWPLLTKCLDRALGDLLSWGVSLKLEVKSSCSKRSLGEHLGLDAITVIIVQQAAICACGIYEKQALCVRVCVGYMVQHMLM